MITLYTTNCGKCNILKERLDAKRVKYQTVTDRQKMVALGMTTAPGLRVDNILMTFTEAMEWANQQEDDKSYANFY